jgi:hypothetical protein
VLFDRVYFGFILLLGNVAVFIPDYTALRNSINQLSYINEVAKNINTYRRGIIIGLF